MNVFTGLLELDLDTNASMQISEFEIYFIFIHEFSSHTQIKALEDIIVKITGPEYNDSLGTHKSG